LRWLHKHPYVPATVLAIATWLIAGWPGLIVGFFWSTVLLYHGTFMINSLAHVHGNKRYVTGDDSRNNWWLALLTLGEGWHNNHHAYMSSTRQGFRWWEVDISYYILKAASWVGIVWDLKEPPAAIVRNEKPLSRGVLDAVAQQLAASYSIEEIATKHRPSWTHDVSVSDLLHLPHLPTQDQLRERAQQMFAATPSLDDIVHRAQGLIAQAVHGLLLHTHQRQESLSA
jgi:stearoyl-CoA desaturase (delta-9 desaturase)